MTRLHPIDRLFAVIESRKGADPATSYTAALLEQGTLQAAKKVGEEGVETALAAVAQNKSCVAAESADLIYHLLILWTACGVTPADVYSELERRAGCSGLNEKAGRAD